MGFVVVGLDIKVLSGPGFDVCIAAIEVKRIFYIYHLEGNALSVGLRNDISDQKINAQCQQSRTGHVGDKETQETNARTEHSNDFGACSKAGCHEHGGNKHRNRTENIGNVGEKIGVIVEQNPEQAGLGFDEIIVFFHHINHTYDQGEHEHNEEKRPQKIFENVEVKNLEVQKTLYQNLRLEAPDLPEREQQR
jgi:hypothetical protein